MGDATELDAQPLHCLRVTQHRPCLSARPGAVVGYALVRVPPQHCAGRRVERRRLAHRSIVANAQLDMPSRVRARHLEEGGVAELAGRPHKERDHPRDAIDVGLAPPD